jgi:hypothetical protein
MLSARSVQHLLKSIISLYPRCEMRSPRKRPYPMTPEMRSAIQSYLTKLVERYSDVAQTGETKKPHPLCQVVEVGHCFDCPVFGEGILKLDHYEAPCVDYFPIDEGYVDDQRSYVMSESDTQTWKQKELGLPSSKERARQWGALVVTWLESLRDEIRGV